MKKRQSRKRYLTYSGSGLETVQRTMAHLGAKLVVCDNVKSAFSAFDGIVLLGGCDISPAMYGERKTHTRAIDVKRDRIEWILARRALAERKPILGLCRGCQFLAVAMGGSLYQDIGIQAHARHAEYHPIQASFELSEHLPSTSVNSYHHQAVKTVPFGMAVSAKGPGGIIEAIYRPGYLGLQWHPEFLIAEGHSEWREPFRWLVEDALR